MSLAIIFNLFVLFIIKVIDNILGTSKTILIQKNKGFIAAVTVVITQVIFYKLIETVMSAENDIQMWVVSIASGVGTYLAVKISDACSKEITYVNVIMSDDKEAMVRLRDYLAEKKMTNWVTDGYTKDWEKTLVLTAYAETKAESKILDTYLESEGLKYRRVVTKKAKVLRNKPCEEM